MMRMITIQVRELQEVRFFNLFAFPFVRKYTSYVLERRPAKQSFSVA